MRLSALVVANAVLAHGVSSQYLWSELIHDQYSSPAYVRQQRTSKPVTDVSSDALRCGDRPLPAHTLQLPAGAKIGFRLKQDRFLPKVIKDLGPVSIYVGARIVLCLLEKALRPGTGLGLNGLSSASGAQHSILSHLSPTTSTNLPLFSLSLHPMDYTTFALSK